MWGARMASERRIEVNGGGSRVLPWLAVLGLLGLAGCEKKGPAEQAGEKVDEAAAEVKEGAQDAGDAMKDAAGDVKDAAEEATDDMKKD